MSLLFRYVGIVDVKMFVKMWNFLPLLSFHFKATHLFKSVEILNMACVSDYFILEFLLSNVTWFHSKSLFLISSFLFSNQTRIYGCKMSRKPFTMVQSGNESYIQPLTLYCLIVQVIPLICIIYCYFQFNLTNTSERNN